MAGFHPFRVPLLVLLAAGLATVQSPAPAAAQQRPEIGYVYPPGGQAGTQIEVQLGGYDWTPDTQFFVHDDRVRLEILGPPGPMLHPGPPHWFGPKARNKPFPVPREVRARFSLPADLPPGPVHWQAANANGATSVGEFLVGPLPEIREDQLPAADPSRPAEARVLPAAPWTLSGRLLHKEEIDHYRLAVPRDGPVTCRLRHGRFGYPFHPLLQVRDAQGQLVADAADTRGAGLDLTFFAKANTAYTLSIHDLDYTGNRAVLYRLSLWQAPRVVAALPSSGVPGTTRRIRFLGIGLASGKMQWESTEREVAFPPDPPGSPLSPFAYRLSPFAYRLSTPFGEAPPLDLERFPLAEQLESELPSADSQAAQPAAAGENPPRAVARRVELPCRVGGVLDEPGVPDSFVFTATKGDSWWIHVASQAIGSPLDVAFQILNEAGKVVASGDDTAGSSAAASSNAALSAAASSDATARWNVPADGSYRLVVRDLSGRAGSADAVYRLSISRPEPDFRLIVPERLEVTLGGEATLPVKVDRAGDLNDPIQLQLVDLPEGLSVLGDLIVPEGKNQLNVKLQAAETAASWARLATLRAVVEGRERTWQQQARLLVAPVMKPRAVVAPLYRDAGRTVHRGATYAAPVVLERFEGYDGPVQLQLAAHPDRVRQGIRGDDLTVPAGVSQIEFPLFLPEWVQTDRTSRIILNTVVQVPDPQGNSRYLVNKMEQRITMNVEGALLKLSLPSAEWPSAEWNLTAGQRISVPVRISRSPKLTGTVRVELASEGLESLFDVQPLELAAQETEGHLTLTCLREPPGGERTLRLRAIALPRADLPVISEAELVLLGPR